MRSKFEGLNSSDRFALEQRQLLTTYVLSSNQWMDRTRITYSIAPDGVNWYKGENSIHASLENQLGPDWETLIAEAFDTWSRSANVDITEVPDQGGQGDYLAVSQGSNLFGDIRIGAYEFQESSLYTLAIASSPPPNGWTQAGDIQINLDSNWIASGQYDIKTVLIHEIGHSLGLEHPTEVSSIMFPIYQGVRQELGPGDIDGIRMIYGPRREDVMTNSGQGMDINTAIEIGKPEPGSNQASQSGLVISRESPADFLKVTVPQGYVGNQLNVTVSASKISMLAPQLSLLNANGDTLKTLSSKGQWGGTVSLDLGQATAGQTFYIKVQASEAGRFDVGSYAVSVQYIGGTIPQPVVQQIPPPATPTIPVPLPVVQPPVVTALPPVVSEVIPAPAAAPINISSPTSVPSSSPVQNPRIIQQRIRLNLRSRLPKKPVQRQVALPQRRIPVRPRVAQSPPRLRRN